MAGEATGTRWTPEPASADGIVADFYSDMKTIPTDGMLQAMLTARVGDEQKGEDPTTNELCARVADLTGKEAAVLLPTGPCATRSPRGCIAPRAKKSSVIGRVKS